MVQGIGCRRLGVQYKFNHCRDCSVYKCELVEEYTQFRESHAQEHKEQILVTADNGEGTLLGVWSKEEYDERAFDLGSADAHSHSDVFDEDVLSYDQTRMKDVCIMRSVYVVECGRKRVAEGIGDHYKIETGYDYRIKEDTEERWESLQPVFISAQTGQGKNYFIEETLIPYVRELNLKHQTRQKVLILSNRLALKKQIKNRLDRNEDLDAGRGIYPYNEYADVMTYQSLLLCEEKLKEKQKYAESGYIYVVCDEAHFFTSDAMFNPHTQKILQTIVRLFQNAVRVYMSATPYECLEYIIKCENEENDKSNSEKYYWDRGRWKYRPMVFYHFTRNYRYLDVKTYSFINELYEEIIESVYKRKEKWLIFIDDKNKCQTVKTQLEKLIKDKESKNKNVKSKNENASEEENNKSKEVERVYFINADSKNRSIYQEIVENERLNKDTYVLISTSVFDNGINLTGIKNIVVSDMAKTKCLQMVGRARVEGDNDRKNLYIKRFDADEVEKRKTDLMEQQDAYGSYERAYDDCEKPRDCYETYRFFEKYYNGSEEDWINAKHWFGKPKDEPTRLYLNKIARSLVERLIPQYQHIRDEMADEKSKEDNAQKSTCISREGQKYLEYQLSWFGKKYCEDKDITFVDKEKAKKEFIAFLETYAEKGTEIVSEEERNEFSDRFINLFDTAFGKSDRNGRQYGARKMNSLLEEQNIGYNIDGKAQVGPWTVIRYNG